ncbi:MAG TPA: cupin domain-containing protein [Thermoplasmata archaeon]|nr:cupin domain-containing protein [Thermoplasmata archaeon]
MSGRRDPDRIPELAPALRDVPIGGSSTTFAVEECREPGRGPGAGHFIAPLHRHRKEDEAWYVLEGEIAVRLDARTVIARSGGAVWSPRGVAHTFWNPSAAPARYLIIMGPKTHQFLQTLPSARPATPEEMSRLADSCGIELLG